MKVIKNNQKIYERADLYQVFEGDKLIGSFLLDNERDDFYLYLEHIQRLPEHKGYRLLEKVVDWIFKELKPEKLTCLPLEKYQSYYEELGFKVYRKMMEDIYYAKTAS